MRAVHTDTGNPQKDVKLVHRSFSQEVTLRKQYAAQKPLWRRSSMGYLCGIPLVGVALLGTLFFQHMLSRVLFPGSFTLLAVLLVALLWGVGPSLFAILVSCVGLTYYFIPPIGQLKVDTIEDALQLFPFVISGLVVALITAQRERARLNLLATEQELQERAEELEEINEKLKETNSLKDRFLSIASHELKTPITTIRGQAQLALRRLTKQSESSQDLDGMRAALEKINEQTGRLTSLVDELLVMSSIRAGKVQLKKRECDLVDLCRGVIEDQQLLTGRQILLEQPATPVKVIIDSDRITQVIVNLVSNALKYSSEGSPVEVAVSRIDQRMVQVQVRDHGKGIAKEEQAHIFDTFYRTSDAQSSTKFGLGLGLSISKDIVERHNGRIWCESEPDKGSIFFVELPTR